MPGSGPGAARTTERECCRTTRWASRIPGRRSAVATRCAPPGGGRSRHEEAADDQSEEERYGGHLSVSVTGGTRARRASPGRGEGRPELLREPGVELDESIVL